MHGGNVFQLKSHKPRAMAPCPCGTRLSLGGDTLITSSTQTFWQSQRAALPWDLPRCCRGRAVPDAVPDAGCFRANALMASNQAVDSREVMAFPLRGRWPGLIPGALPTHCPCHVPAGCALLTLRKFPATASEMGIDTGLSVHGHLPLAKPCCDQGSWHGSLGRERAGTWGHHGDQHQHDPLPGTQGAVVTAGYSHHRASQSLGPKGAWAAQHSPCVIHGGHTRS